MAARRLLYVMLIFLAISTVLAVLAPPPAQERETTTTGTSTAPADPQPTTEGELVRARVDVRPRGGSLIGHPESVRAQVGDQLALTVAVEQTLTLEAPSLGLVETAVPGAPARFDLFASRADTHQFRDVSTGKPLFRVRIDPAPADQAGGRNEGRSVRD